MLLFADRKLFDQGCVPLGVSGTFDDVASGVAECSKDRVVGKGAGVKQRSRNARFGVRIADQIGARAIEANRAAAIAARDIVDVSRGVVIAGSFRKYAGHLPVANNLVHGTV